MLQFKNCILYDSLSWSGTEIERADLYILWRISLSNTCTCSIKIINAGNASISYNLSKQSSDY